MLISPEVNVVPPLLRAEPHLEPKLLKVVVVVRPPGFFKVKHINLT